MNDFTDVYNEYAEPVRRFLVSLTQNEELAAELTQETVKEDFQYGKLEDGKFYYTNESTKIPEENIDEWLRDRNEYYNKNKDLTYEQFYAIKKSNFISQLQQWRKNGYKISAFGWDSAYENGDEINNIDFNVHVRDRDGTTRTGVISLGGNNKGKFIVGGGSYLIGDAKRELLILSKIIYRKANSALLLGSTICFSIFYISSIKLVIRLTKSL